MLFGLILAGPAAAQAIGSGFYSVTGTDIDGETYEKIAAITIDGASCTMIYGVGDEPVEATCVVYEDTVAAAYAFGDSATLMLYKIREKGVLEGVWTMQAEDGVGSEVLTPYR